MNFRVFKILFSISITATTNGNGLGPANGFTIFTFDSYQANNTDCTGRVAVGGSGIYNNFGVGSDLINSYGSRDDLIIGGSLDWNNGQIFNGNIQSSGSTSLTNVGIPNGNISSNVNIDFTSAKEVLIEISDSLFDQEANGTTSNAWGEVSMVGTNPEFNIFVLTSNELSPLWGMSIDVPQGSTVLVNIEKNAIQLNNFQTVLIGCEPSNVLFNFHETAFVQMNSIGWKGTILAPKATIQFNNGQIDGALICTSIQGNGESHHAPFNGMLPGDSNSAVNCDCCCHGDIDWKTGFYVVGEDEDHDYEEHDTGHPDEDEGCDCSCICLNKSMALYD